MDVIMQIFTAKMLILKVIAYFAVIFSAFSYSVMKNVFVGRFYFLKPCVMAWNFAFVCILYKWLFNSVQNKLSNYFSYCNSDGNFFLKLSLLIILFLLGGNRSLNRVMATRILFCSFTDNNLFIRLLFLCIFVFYSFTPIQKHWIKGIWYASKRKYIIYFTFFFPLGHSILKNSWFYGPVIRLGCTYCNILSTLN